MTIFVFEEQNNVYDRIKRINDDYKLFRYTNLEELKKDVPHKEGICAIDADSIGHNNEHFLDLLFILRKKEKISLFIFIPYMPIASFKSKNFSIDKFITDDIDDKTLSNIINQTLNRTYTKDILDAFVINKIPSHYH